MEQRAYFVYHPRRIYDLCVPHLPEQELAFEITAVKALSKLDYENFSEDVYKRQVPSFANTSETT